LTAGVLARVGEPFTTMEENVYTTWESVLDTLSPTELERLENNAILESAIRGKSTYERFINKSQAYRDIFVLTNANFIRLADDPFEHLTASHWQSIDAAIRANIGRLIAIFFFFYDMQFC
jgi:hypothetical protein